MVKNSLGLKKDNSAVMAHKRLGVQQFEEDFLNYWRSLGFKKELDKNSKSYANSIKSLRKVLSNVSPWEGITLSQLKSYCDAFKVYAESNSYRKQEEIKGDLKKLYFHQFVESYSGFSYLRAIHEGKIKASVFSSEDKAFAEEIANVLSKMLNRKVFSSGENLRILKFSKDIRDFYNGNANKIALGIDDMTIVRGIFAIITEFRKTKSIAANVLIYTGNYAIGAALDQAMERFGYWKIYSKLETPEMAMQKDPEKVKKFMEQKKAKEEECLPDIVKKRREDLKNRGIEIKTQDKEDCSRKEAYLQRKKSRKTIFSK